MKTTKNSSRSEETNRILENIVYLGILQGANYILPLLTLPYLIRVIGPEYFGLIAFATAVNAYFVLITDYGFDLSATRQISIHRDDQKKVTEIFSSVMIIKLTLLVLSFFSMSVIVFSFERLTEYWELYFATFGMVIGQALFPVWLFQGLERMGQIAYLNVGAKAFFAAAIFILVQEESDYILVPILNSLGLIIAGVWSLFLIRKKFLIRFVWQSQSAVKYYFKEGWHIFLSRLYVNLYRQTNIIILGIMTNTTIVGYYAIAEKIIQAITGLFYPVLKAVYPYFAKLYDDSRPAFFSLFQRMISFLFCFSILFSILSFIFSGDIVSLVSGSENPQVTLLLMILSFSVITSPFGPAFTEGLLVCGRSEVVSKVVRDTSIFNMIIVGPLIYLFGAVGLAITWCVGQVYHAGVYALQFRNAKKELLCSDQGAR